MSTKLLRQIKNSLSELRKSEKIVGEFLQSIGYLPGAHNIECPVYEKIELLNPPWKMI